VMDRDPTLDELRELPAAFEQIPGFRVGGGSGVFVTQPIAFAPTSIEVMRFVTRCLSQCERQSKECGEVASRPFHPVAGTCDRHAGEQERRFVGEPEPIVRRETRDRRVEEVAFDGAPQRVNLLPARDVSLDAALARELLPGHAHPLR